MSTYIPNQFFLNRNQDAIKHLDCPGFKSSIAASTMKCRHCQAECTLPLIDLGSAPLSNAYLTHLTLRRPEKWFPLKVLVCQSCWLVQAEAYSSASELFNKEYAYFSSFSDQWLKHAKKYAQEMILRFGLNKSSHVVEIASNDGYLLQYFKNAGIPCLGIEPASSTALASRLKGIETIEEFFGQGLSTSLCDQGRQADLMVANNVLAHVPEINDFVSGFTTLLKKQGVATFEFPHLMKLIECKEFDTIYHEHFSYLSVTAVNTIFNTNGLSIFDIQELRTHGGSLRIFAQRSETGKHPVQKSVADLLNLEKAVGMHNIQYYLRFQDQANKIKNDFLCFLLEARSNKYKVCGYGAAAKGNTLLNFAGVRPDLLPYIVDRNPAKQGKFMPGSRIPILMEKILKEHRPEYIIILPWNIKDEIMEKLAYIKDWGGKFVTAVPYLKFFDA